MWLKICYRKLTSHVLPRARLRVRPRPMVFYYLLFLTIHLCVVTVLLRITGLLCPPRTLTSRRHKKPEVTNVPKESSRPIRNMDGGTHELTDNKLILPSCRKMAAWPSNIDTWYNLSGVQLELMRSTEGIYYKIESDIRREMELATDGDLLSPSSEFKNPCWRAAPPADFNNLYETNPYWLQNMDATSRMTMRRNRDILLQRQKLNKLGDRVRCLPFFYVVGVTKAGTTDFCEAMKLLPDIVAPAAKEPMYWNRVRMNGLLNATLGDYIDGFDRLGIKLASPKNKHQITFEGTPCYLWDYRDWHNVPPNHEFNQPKYILAHTLRAIFPSTKIIMLLRDPVNRVYSQYRMWHPLESAETFHAEVEKHLKVIAACLTNKPLRVCAYSPCGYEKSCRMLYTSLYFVFVRDWLAVFPPDQVLIIKSEEYFENRTMPLYEVVDFLELGGIATDTIMTLGNMKPVNTLQGAVFKKRSQEKMLPETRTLLTQFYTPFNSMLADLLHDRKWLWE